jgi:ankyrin repeat protein
MLHKSLASLPRTLDQTYDRILTAIGEEYSEYAMRILQWLTFSARPLSVEEVAEVVAIDVARDPAFDGDEVLEDPLEVLDICSSLVTITTNEVDRRSGSTQRTVALAHYSVQEYLVSDRIRQGQAKQYSMQAVKCHNTIAEGCLKYLMRFQQPISTHILKEFALARYAAQFWSNHLRKTGDEVDAVSWVAMSLMSIEQPAYLVWIQLFDPDEQCEEPDLTKCLESIAMPLYYAALLGLSAIAGKLLDQGAYVNAPGGRYGNALNAASLEGHKQVIRMLLDKGAEINGQGGDYVDALHLASLKGHEQVVKMLLNNGADVNAQCGHYDNALQAASSKGHERVVKILLDAGADVNMQGGDYGNALQAASFESHEQVVKILLDAGADVNMQGGDYGNALQAASWGGCEQTVKMLLDKGAKVNMQGGFYGNALQAASERGHEQVVRMLLDAGAEVNAQGGEFGNALQAASFGSRGKVVKMLLDAGAHQDQKGSYKIALLEFQASIPKRIARIFQSEYRET